MADDRPFHDLRRLGGAGAFTLPSRKWREIVFVRALRRGSDGLYRRDPDRPLPPMREPELFPVGVAFRAEPLPDPTAGRADPKNPRRRDRSRIRLTPVRGAAPPPPPPGPSAVHGS